jgi:hypothetical protein
MTHFRKRHKERKNNIKKQKVTIKPNNCKNCQKSCQKVLNKLLKSCQKVVKNLLQKHGKNLAKNCLIFEKGWKIILKIQKTKKEKTI